MLIEHYLAGGEPVRGEAAMAVSVMAPTPARPTAICLRCGGRLLR